MDELINKLQEYLTDKREKDNISIENFTKINLGYETEKYAFTEISTTDKKRTANKFVLRMRPNVDECLDVKKEFILMDRLYKEGFPVPRVIVTSEWS